eukprot:3480788-Rhodomonas_salina.2
MSVPLADTTAPPEVRQSNSHPRSWPHSPSVLGMLGALLAGTRTSTAAATLLEPLTVVAGTSRLPTPISCPSVTLHL